MEINAFFTGFLLNMGLIVGMGAQNAFVLRQAVLRQYVVTVVTISILCDAMLIAAGVAGLGILSANFSGFISFLRWSAILLLSWYGVRTLVSAIKGVSQLREGKGVMSLKAAALAATAIALLNPHVYFDTVVMLGTASTAFPLGIRYWFALGAALMSATWFIGLALLAGYYSEHLTKPKPWRALEGITGVTLLFSALIIARF